MKKAREGVKQVCSGMKILRLHKLNYLQVVIKGTLRLDNTVPLLCSENCDINWYAIPKTIVLVNAWTIEEILSIERT